MFLCLVELRWALTAAVHDAAPFPCGLRTQHVLLRLFITSGCNLPLLSPTPHSGARRYYRRDATVFISSLHSLSSGVRYMSIVCFPATL